MSTDFVAQYVTRAQAKRAAVAAHNAAYEARQKAEAEEAAKPKPTTAEIVAAMLVGADDFVIPLKRGPRGELCARAPRSHQ